ncbi:MAG: xanthine dehydrogenase family protein subunit M [Chloroflexi bacterium]|nr:xanthine dehydrogenase family protein subunit M [Chloroflexota bacterium]
MYPASFEYARPETLEEALELLAQWGDEAKLLAGGASLVPLMKLRLAQPRYVIDIGRLRGLAGEARQDGHLAIRALTRHVEVQDSATIRSALPILHDITSQIGDPQIRNMGTLGGSVAECDPAGDWAPGLLALDASVYCVSQRGERTIAARDLFLDAFTTALEPDEVLTEVLFPLPPARSGGAHLKLERRAGDFAIANCSVQVTLDEAGRYQQIGIGVGGIALAPLKVVAAEDLLRGQQPGEDLLRQAAQAVSDCTESFSDIRGSAAYRKHVAGVLFRRALALAERRARGESVEVQHG